MIEYRLADTGDIDALARIRVAFLCEGKDVADDDKEQLLINNRSYFNNGMVDDSFVSWVALDAGSIIATSGVTLYLLPPNQGCPSGKTAYISNMYTRPDYRGQGIATKLFALIADEAKSLGCGRLLLHATDMGRPIYEKYGFEDNQTGMAYYPE